MIATSQRRHGYRVLASRPAAPATDWASAGVVSGFVATFVMTLATAAGFGLAVASGDRSGNQIERWFWALGEMVGTASGEIQRGVVVGVHLTLGIGWAVAYARVGEAALRGPGWSKGLRFAAVPWALSALAVGLPVGTTFGRAVEAGPLPILGSLLLHAVYGVVLGTVYGMTVESGFDGAANDRASAVAAERGAAYGLVVGAVTGLCGAWVLDAALDIGARDAVALAGAMIGAAGGLGAGSLLGMGGGGRDRSPVSR